MKYYRKLTSKYLGKWVRIYWYDPTAHTRNTLKRIIKTPYTKEAYTGKIIYFDESLVVISHAHIVDKNDDELDGMTVHPALIYNFKVV